MAKKKKQVQTQRPTRVKIRVVDTIGRVLNTAIAWGGAVGIGYFIFRSVEVLAGDTTTANIGIKFMANVTVSKAVAWMFGASGVAYGVGQRKLRRDTIAKLQQRIRFLEKDVDARRTTSGLTPRGETREEDK